MSELSASDDEPLCLSSFLPRTDRFRGFLVYAAKTPAYSLVGNLQQTLSDMSIYLNVVFWIDMLLPESLCTFECHVLTTKTLYLLQNGMKILHLA